MIPSIIVIALTWLPPEPVTSTTPWHEQFIIEIPAEPTEEQIDQEWRTRRVRILENTNGDR